jgi:hypothetical protein
VEEGDVGRDVVRQQLIHHALVVVHSLGIGLARALGEDPRPGEGHAVAADAQGFEQLHVLLIKMVGVVGYVACFAVKGFAGRV